MRDADEADGEHGPHGRMMKFLPLQILGTPPGSCASHFNRGGKDGQAV